MGFKPPRPPKLYPTAPPPSPTVRELTYSSCPFCGASVTDKFENGICEYCKNVLRSYK